MSAMPNEVAQLTWKHRNVIDLDNWTREELYFCLDQARHMDGIVCSPLDLQLLKGKAARLLRVVPGIRAAKVSTEDQTRVATAEDAAKNGAGYIVIGRPILEAADPIFAAKDIIRRLSEVEY